MNRRNPSFFIWSRSIVVVWIGLLSNSVVQSQNAACGENRCIRIGDNTLKFTTCGATCATQTCIDLTSCSAANNEECGPDACVSAAYLEARAVNQGLYKTYSDPCCGPSDPCFSAFASANVFTKGKTLIQDLQVGDEVLTASGAYKQVYTIDHKHPNKAAEFLQIYTSENEDASPLEVTENHLVFLHNRKDPVPAGQLKVGDALQRTSAQPAVVTKISSVVRNGLWNPITEDGTIVVDGIVTSTYTALDIISNGNRHSMYVEVGGYKVMSKHDFIHLLMTPYRTVCYYTPSSFCKVPEKEEFNSYNQLGLQVLKVSRQLPLVIQNAFAIGAILLLGSVYWIVGNPLVISALSVSGVMYYYYCYYITTTTGNKKTN